MSNPPQARKLAEHYEREAADHPEERAEILLEAAGQWRLAGEPERALRIYDEVIASAPYESDESAQYAAADRLDALAILNRGEDIETELQRLLRIHVNPGPASMIAEFLEGQGQLGDALTWFNIACRDVDADEIDESTLFGRNELQGRARVRRALDLPPDKLDEQTEQAHSSLRRALDNFARHAATPNRVQRSAATYFVRADVEQALATGLVHLENARDLDPDTYFQATERAWRDMAEQGLPRLELVPTHLDEYLRYVAEHDLDARDQQTRLNYVQWSIREGAPTIDWPPPRNAPCWCGSGRKYKKCCGGHRFEPH